MNIHQSNDHNRVMNLLKKKKVLLDERCTSSGTNHCESQYTVKLFLTSIVINLKLINSRFVSEEKNVHSRRVMNTDLLSFCEWPTNAW